MTVYTLYEVFAVWRVFYPYSCSQFGLATFQALRSPLWPAAAMGGSAGLDHGSCFADSGLEQLASGLVPQNAEGLLSLKAAREAACTGWFRGSDDLHGGQEEVLGICFLPYLSAVHMWRCA